MFPHEGLEYKLHVAGSRKIWAIGEPQIADAPGRIWLHTN